jgi:hypothetical protein
MVAIAIQNCKKGDVIHLRSDPLLASMSNISLGEFGLFFVADLSIGLSIAFRIEYESGKVLFGQLSRFESEGPPFSVVSDRAAVAATFYKRKVTIWNLCSATVHRVLQFDEKVTALAIDAAFTGIFVATVRQLYYVSVNGDVLCESLLEEGERITTVQFVGKQIGDAHRYGFCGTTTGEVWVVVAGFQTKSFDLLRLASPHKCEVRELVVHPMKGILLSVDTEGVVCSWTWSR